MLFTENKNMGVDFESKYKDLLSVYENLKRENELQKIQINQLN